MGKTALYFGIEKMVVKYIFYVQDYGRNKLQSYIDIKEETEDISVEVNCGRRNIYRYEDKELKKLGIRIFGIKS